MRRPQSARGHSGGGRLRCATHLLRLGRSLLISTIPPIETAKGAPRESTLLGSAAPEGCKFSGSHTPPAQVDKMCAEARGPTERNSDEARLRGQPLPAAAYATSPRSPSGLDSTEERECCRQWTRGDVILSPHSIERERWGVKSAKKTKLCRASVKSSAEPEEVEGQHVWGTA
jgi:hypothetical protein